MGIFGWVQDYWAEILQSVSTGTELFGRRKDRIFQNVTNRIIFTERHRQLWERQASDPKLSRIKLETADLEHRPLTLVELNFLEEVFHHFADCFHAKENGVFKMPEAISLDIKTFFALPLPKAGWERSKKFQDRAFVVFVETHL